MLLVYRVKSGEVLDNTGTNSAFPRGPSDEDGYINTDAAHIPRSDLAQLRLHDVEDAALVQQVLRRGCRVVNGHVQLLDESTTATEPVPVPDGAIAYGTVTTAGPPVEVDLSTGEHVAAGRLAGYTPEAGHMVKLSRISGQWVVEDRVLLTGEA